MINEEDIKVGLRFYMTRKHCLKCNFDPIETINDIPILFTIAEKRSDYYLCTSVISADRKYFAHFSEMGIMAYGDKLNIVPTDAKEQVPQDPCEEGDIALRYMNEQRSKAIAKDGAGEQVSHPSHYAWLKDLCGVEPIDICRHFDFAIGNALKYLMRKGKVDGDKTEKEKRIEDLKKAVFYIQDEIKLLQDGE